MATPVTEEPIAKSKKPSNSAFKQQRLPAWQPILTAGTVLPTFFVIGLAFIPIGIGLLVSSNDVQEFAVPYTNCMNAQNHSCEDVIKNKTLQQSCTCEIKFHLPEQYKEQVYVYYSLTNYYQNHRRYVKSRDDKQLQGQFPEESKDCIPFDYREFPNGTKTKIAPCGAIANSLFNDKFELQYLDNRSNTYIPVHLIKQGIAWPTDKKVKFKNPGNPSSSWAERFRDTTYPPNWNKPVYELDSNASNTGYENEDLIVWMRTAALPTFRKLYGKIDHSKENFRNHLPLGDYKLTVAYNYPVTSFKGTKKMILSNTSWLGGKNPFLGIAYIVVGTICLILAFIFLLIHNKFGRTPNDIVSISQRTPY